MKIELANVSIYKRASEETIACDANVLIDGVKVGTVSNSGKGEGYYPHIKDAATFAKMQAYIEALPPKQTEYGPLSMNVDFFFSLLVGDYEIQQEAKKLMRDRIMFWKGDNLMQSKKMTAEQKTKVLAKPLAPGLRLATLEEVVAQLRG